MDILVSRTCKSDWVAIQSKVGLQTHQWKLMMVIMCDPIDTHVHVRKYMAGSLNNNVIELALKVNLGITYKDDSEIQVIEKGSPGDGFSSDLDPDDLTSIFKANAVASQDSPIMAAGPNMQSTIMAPPVVSPRVATPSVEMKLPGPSTKVSVDTPKNPSKKIKVEVDRDMAKDLAKSLSSFASLLQANNESSSSGDSFEVVNDDK